MVSPSPKPPCLHPAAPLVGALLFALLGALAAAAPAGAQMERAPGRSVGTVTTEGKLIILTLDEDALGRPHLFDLAHRTLRFTPEAGRYRVETLPEAWDGDLGTELKAPDQTLTRMSFPFSGQRWTSLSIGLTGSITFGPPEPSGGQGGARPNRGGGLAVERYALLKRVGSTFINSTPAISVFFKPRMEGARYLKELGDRAVITWTLTEPYGGIQDWSWIPTVNRFQAVLYGSGVIDLTYDELSARDGIVGIFPRVQGGEERPLAALRLRDAAPQPQLAFRGITLSEIDGLYLKAKIEMAGELPAADQPGASGLAYHLCLSAAGPGVPCSRDRKDATVWTVAALRGFGPQRSRPGRTPRYTGFGDGLDPEVTVEGTTITLKGILPAGVRPGSTLYVSAAAETADGAQTGSAGARAVPLKGIGSPEMDLAALRRQDGAFPVIYESFYYPDSPRPNDLTCSVIKALGDRFDLLAYYSDFRVDNPEAGTPSTGPLGGGPEGGEVTGIGARQRNLASYCTAGRFQWQYVQPVYMGANQIDEYPPPEAASSNRRDVQSYTHQLAERTFNGRIPPYDYAMSQIGHEMGHRWSAFVSARINGELIPLGPTHWATGLQAPVPFPYQRPTEASAMGGGVWQDNYDGTFTQLDDDYYVPATGYSYLDLYLMGLVSAAEVPDFFLLRNLELQGHNGDGRPVFRAERTRITINDVIAAEGPRLPDVDHAQRSFNTGMVIVLEHGHQPPAALLRNVEGIRLRWMDYWETTTGHRSVMTADPN